MVPPLIGGQTDLGYCDLGLNFADLGLRLQSIPCTLPEQRRAQITIIFNRAARSGELPARLVMDATAALSVLPSEA